jgi:hypothetical protein
MASYSEALRAHYQKAWSSKVYREERWTKGPMASIAPDFSVLVFRPHGKRDMWTYATSGMSNTGSETLELHLFSPSEAPELVELLTVVAHFHLTAQPLGIGHTVNFGRPWLDSSMCDHGLVSLPYLDGPKLEEFSAITLSRLVRCLWLIPVTRNEVRYKQEKGMEALEARFEEVGFDYVNPQRSDVTK